MNTIDMAYAEGFCKAAELLGVNHRSLVRYAAIKDAAEKRAGDDGVRAIGNSNLEGLGRYTSVGALTTLGGMAGKGKGAVAGLLTGLLANLGGRATAAVTKARTSGQQIAYDKTLKLRNLIIPAFASYNRAKRLERQQIHAWH